MTTSASAAARRAANTWQRANSPQRLPRQFSRVEVKRARSGSESESPGTSARSPLRVARAHSAMCSSMPRAGTTLPGSGSSACATSRRWRQR